MNNKFFRDRFSILSFLVIIMILTITYKLVLLQIVNGKYYKSESEKKLLRVNSVEAPRGEILDRFGRVLANNRPGFNIEITKTKVGDETLNASLLEIINIFQKNNDRYKDNLPIVLPNQFLFNNQKEEETWKKKYKITLAANPRQAFDELKTKYKIDSKYTDDIARKIMTLRYEMSEQGYNSFKSVVLASDITKETVSQVEERHLEFPGVNVVVTPIRNYPNGTLASHILGYISKINQDELKKYQQKGLNYNQNDNVGKQGIEKYAEEYLKGKAGKKFVEADLSGRLSNSLEDQESIPGGKIILTIDQKIQKIAEESLQKNIELIRSGAYSNGTDVKGGSAVVLDVNTGEVLALASYPNYDPAVFSKGISIQEWNKIQTDQLKPMFNRTISGKYPPGSTFKMVTAIAALESGAISIKETIKDLGKYEYFDKVNPPKCWIWTQSGQTHGDVDVISALKVSCNYYFYEIGRRLGIEKIVEYAKLFGLDKRTNIEIEGEETSIIAGPETRERLHKLNKAAYPNTIWYPGNTLQAAIGQSDTTITPIALASYISMIANGGIQYQLHLIKSEKSYDEKQIYLENSKKVINKITLNSANLDAIREGMREVTGDEGGTAYNTFKDFPEDIKIAGKTGTAQVGIAGKSPHAWFSGFAPYNNPQIAVVVSIENGGSGAYTTPIAKDIFAEYFGLNNPVQNDESQPAVNNNQTDVNEE